MRTEGITVKIGAMILIWTQTHVYNWIVFILGIAKHFCCYWGGIWVKLGTSLVVQVSLRYKGWVNGVIIKVNTEINYSCNYIQVFLKYQYNVKLYVSALYLMNNLNVST